VGNAQCFSWGRISAFRSFSISQKGRNSTGMATVHEKQMQRAARFGIPAAILDPSLNRNS
jgi:hypothetical protein